MRDSVGVWREASTPASREPSHPPITGDARKGNDGNESSKTILVTFSSLKRIDEILASAMNSTFWSTSTIRKSEEAAMVYCLAYQEFALNSSIRQILRELVM